MNTGLIAMLLVAFFSVHGAAKAEDLEFDAADEDGLAVIGVRGDSDEAFDLVFARYVPETQKLDAGSFSGHTTIEHEGRKGEIKYHVFRIEAGTHVFKSLNQNSYRQRFTACLNKGTFAFDIRAGEALYLGDFSAWGIVLFARLPPNLEAARAALAAYPNVSVELKSATLRPVTFLNGRSLTGREVCGGYY
jgi:hypothetical protein